MYNTVPTPTVISAIVKIFCAELNSRTSRNPTVETVVTVWYMASINDNPSTR